jgi:DNA processing protein
VNLISAFRNQPMVIVSGLAFGIDSLAHQEALNSKLKTIAVLGSGLDEKVIYPKENIRLARNIINSGGLLVSEYSRHTKPMLHHFPKRNRILAGLSKATIVISGAAKSGTLITAQVALDEGRDVYALPGNVNQLLSQGPNNLIKSGANILLSPQEILSLYNIEGIASEKKLIFNNQLQAKAYGLLQIEALSSVQLANKLKLSLPQTNTLISELELMGLAKSNKLNQIEIK